MRTLPEDLARDELIESLSEGWGLDVVLAEYMPVGFGSYHWAVIDGAGRRLFVTVDDLDRKGYLGGTRDSAFKGLRSAFDTALALRDRGGLEFVVAPLPTPRGVTVRRIGPRHTAAVFPFVEGISPESCETGPPSERADVVHMLVRLHQATPSVAAAARPASLRPHGRRGLESALRDLDRSWAGGPFSESARALLAGHAEEIRGLLETFDHLADQVGAARMEPVFTHGEPHSRNIVSSHGRLLLVDWDTVGLAPPERDLWMVDAGAGDELMQYAKASGRPVDGAAIRLYRVRWQLDDIATFVNWFRSTHQQTADTEKGWLSFARAMESEALLRSAGG